MNGRPALLLLVAALLGAASLRPAMAGGLKYYDLYLTGNRMCKQCTWRWVDARHVEISNRQGQAAVIEGAEILGYDKHPIARRVFLKGVHGIGLPGPVVVPYAFDDYQEYVCKYCDP